MPWSKQFGTELYSKEWEVKKLQSLTIIAKQALIIFLAQIVKSQ